MKHTAATTAATVTSSPIAASDRPCFSAGQLERLSIAYTFARAREEGRRGRVAEIAAALLFGGCVAFSVVQCATTSLTLHRSGALEQVVARAMPKTAPAATAPAATATAAADTAPTAATAVRPL